MTTTGAMADTGANVCITDTEDGLTNVHRIPPVTLNLALDNGSDMTYPSCNLMGYLPMVRTDGLEHLQPFLINKAATDTIVSPESILHASTDFHSWHQVGYKNGPSGRLEFRDKEGKILLDLRLEKQNGLYYCPLNLLTRSQTYPSLSTNPMVNKTEQGDSEKLDGHMSRAWDDGPLTQPDISNLSFGLPDLVTAENGNSTNSQGELTGYPTNSSTTHFASWTSNNKPRFDDKRLDVKQNGSP